MIVEILFQTIFPIDIRLFIGVSFNLILSINMHIDMITRRYKKNQKTSIIIGRNVVQRQYPFLEIPPNMRIYMDQIYR